MIVNERSTFALPRHEDYDGVLKDKTPAEVAFILTEALNYLGLRYVEAPPTPHDGLYGVQPLPELPHAQELYRSALYLIESMARGKPRSMARAWLALHEYVVDAEGKAVEQYREHEFDQRFREMEERDRKSAQRDKRARVYFIAGSSGPIKIGVAANPEARRKELQTSHHERLTILATTKGGRSQEREYHRRFADRRLAGEWFQRCPEILAEIERLSIPARETVL